MQDELKGVVVSIDSDFIMIESGAEEYFSSISDFFDSDINVGDTVIFKPVEDIVLKATLISKDCD